MVSKATTSMITSDKVGTRPGMAGEGTPLKAAPGHELAMFGMGCFWGSETLYREVPGVTATTVGYAGGKTQHPTYREVCSHTTGHNEVVLVEFDKSKTSYEKLLKVFWDNHNPTTLNRQGPDSGDQYRSGIYTFSDEQKATAEASKKAEAAGFTQPIVTEILPVPQFWIAEGYHQQYHDKTGSAACPVDFGNRKG
ncbi:peptide-methionine (S)-S-oxide reductase [bacterium]|nr:MAG: peptide-methionine (S)-S-oxide reductase [bacterium]